MEVLTTLITGIFSLLSALGSVWLKDWLERRKQNETQATTEKREEVDQQPAPAPQKPGWSWKRPLILFFGAFALGLVTRVMRPLFGHQIHWETLAAVVVLAGATLWLAINHLRTGSSLWSFELEVLAIWLAWASGWSVIHGSAWSDLIVFALLWWLGCAVIGGLVAVVGRKKAAT